MSKPEPVFIIFCMQYPEGPSFMKYFIISHKYVTPTYFTLQFLR